jgi:hypothetical protein
MNTVAHPDMVTRAARPRLGKTFQMAALAYIGWNVVVSIVGLIAKLPDLPASHAHTDRLTFGQVLAGNGTIMSPPLVLMIIIGVLVAASTSSRAWISRGAAALTALLVGLSVIDETTGFSDKPALYSTGKWHLCIALGTVFDILGIAVVITGVLWAIASRPPQS